MSKVFIFSPHDLLVHTCFLKWDSHIIDTQKKKEKEKDKAPKNKHDVKGV